IATSDGYVSIDDSRDDPSQILIFYLDHRCRVTRTLGYPTPARDPEDLAQGPDGTLWVADTGDNFNNPNRRTTVALWHVPAGGRPASGHLPADLPRRPARRRGALLHADGDTGRRHQGGRRNRWAVRAHGSNAGRHDNGRAVAEGWRVRPAAERRTQPVRTNRRGPRHRCRHIAGSSAGGPSYLR